MTFEKRGYELHASVGFWRGRALEFYLVNNADDGKEYLIYADERPNVDIAAHIGIQLSPSFQLFPERAQKLFDDLYQSGFRPTMKTDDPGAISRHLEDMRTIAFAKLNIPTPGGK